MALTWPVLGGRGAVFLVLISIFKWIIPISIVYFWLGERIFLVCDQQWIGFLMELLAVGCGHRAE